MKKGNICKRCGCEMSMFHGQRYGNCTPLNKSEYDIIDSEELITEISKDNPFRDN